RGVFSDPALVHGGEVRAAAFSPDERLILTASDDGTARLWDRETKSPVGPPFDHGAPIHVTRYCPDGRLVLAGSIDGAAPLWAVATGRGVGPPLRHRGRVSGAAFSHDGRLFATGSTGGTAHLWDTPVPLEGDPELIMRRIEVMTGMTLGDNGET